jgi:hypothetical protein
MEVMPKAFNPLVKKGFDRYSEVQIVDSLPDGVNGHMAYLTTDSTLYVYYNAWVAIGTGTPVTGGTFDFMDDTDFDFMDGTAYDFMDT